MRVIATLAILVSVLPGAADDPKPRGNGGTSFWSADLEAARRYARQRPGDVSFAIIGAGSRLRGFHKARTAPAASTIKAMLLAAYLRQPSIRRRQLRAADRALLEPMIRASDNAAAAEVAAIVSDRVERVARAAQMRDFEWVWEPGWIGGQSQISARDQARFFLRYPRYLPKRHRRFARRLLASIVPWQRWGIADARPPGWRIYFKGGWGIADDGVGVVNHQIAFLERGDCRIALAILTEHNPSTADGAETQRGLAKRLLRGVGRAPCPGGRRKSGLSRRLDLREERWDTFGLLAAGTGAELGQVTGLLPQSSQQLLAGSR
jgi:Beta-lactamase enzyme family